MHKVRRVRGGVSIGKESERDRKCIGWRGWWDGETGQGGAGQGAGRRGRRESAERRTVGENISEKV